MSVESDVFGPQKDRERRVLANPVDCMVSRTFRDDEKPRPNYAPIYAAALYPELATLARVCGYALAVHGSLRRDFDLVAIPWVDDPNPPEDLLDDITKKFAIRLLGGPTEKPHGRKAWTISIGHGECALDISFMPVVSC